MHSIDQWLDEYDESHQNKTNKILHWICVPLIILSLLGLLWPLSISFAQNVLPFRFNLAIITVLFALLYYFLLSPPLTVGMLLLCTLMLLTVNTLSELVTPLWMPSIVIFVLAWVGQFIGHRIEGKSPSFFKDIQFLLIGPLWLLSFVYRKMGIRYS